jgi:putative FmdB family regulatory protein
MPTYEYRCTACGREFEELQAINDPPLEKCPQCGQAVERLLSAGAGFIFKGAGFYATDHRSKEYTKQASSESAPASPAAPVTSGAPSKPQPSGGKS